MDSLLACLGFLLESAVFEHNFIGVFCVVLIGLQKVLCSALHTLYSLEFIMYCICMTAINVICICNMYVYMYNSYKQRDLFLQ